MTGGSVMPTATSSELTASCCTARSTFWSTACNCATVGTALLRTRTTTSTVSSGATKNDAVSIAALSISGLSISGLSISGLSISGLAGVTSWRLTATLLTAMVVGWQSAPTAGSAYVRRTITW